MRRYSDSYLMAQTKRTLIDLLRCAEHNEDSALQTLEQHIKNVKDWSSIRHGHWINEKSDVGYYFAEYDYECSLCGGHTGFSRSPQSRYCPNCGAKMDTADTDVPIK